MVFRNRDKRGVLRYYPRVQAVSVDRDVLERVAVALGGATVRVHKKATDKNQEIFLVKVTGKKAKEVMKRVRPYMGSRRGSKIDELLAEFEGEVTP